MAYHRKVGALPTLRMRRGLVATAAVLLVLTAGCSDSSKVGGGLEVGEGAQGEGCRLGECTTTTPSTTATTSAPKTTQTTKAPPATTKATTATTSRQAIYVIKIYPDSAGHQFQPRQATVKKGTLVRWTNTDSETRSVEADNGEFKSPPLAPGATFEFTAQQLGSFNYHDGTRPFAVANLEVVA